MLRVRNLTVDYRGGDGAQQRAVDNFSFGLKDGETVGLLGQSGCGKTTLAHALLGLLPSAAHVVSGSIQLGGHDILTAGERTLRTIRGAAASLVFQEPAMSLNPVLPVGRQIAEIARAHGGGRRKKCRARAEDALAAVRLSEARIYSAYPHELSSGQRQRVAIAQALVCRPGLVIADEPTSALDTVTQAEILGLFKDLKASFEIGLLFITHDPSLLSGLADRVLIMHAGALVEESSLTEMFERPRHPYTESLLRSIPPLPGREAARVQSA